MKYICKGLLILMMFSVFLCCAGNTVLAKKRKNEVKIKNVTKVKEVTCTDYGKDYISLSWEKVNKAEGYEIYRSTKAKKGYELVGTVKKGRIITWTDSDLKKDTKYFYKVRAFWNKGKGKVFGDFSKYYKQKTAKTQLESITQYTYVPYRGGGFTTAGWDCSGFTKWALKEYYGVDIPKGAAAQGNSGKKISLSNRKKWKPGDVLIYLDDGRIGHVALYLGDNKLMHALNSRFGTIIQDVDYYETWDSGTRLIGVRRFTGNRKK